MWQRDASATNEANIDNLEFLLANGPKQAAYVGAKKQICTFEASGTRPVLDENFQLNQTGKMLARAAQRLFR
jgi:hypothetical protein